MKKGLSAWDASPSVPPRWSVQLAQRKKKGDATRKLSSGSSKRKRRVVWNKATNSPAFSNSAQDINPLKRRWLTVGTYLYCFDSVTQFEYVTRIDLTTMELEEDVPLLDTDIVKATMSPIFASNEEIWFHGEAIVGSCIWVFTRYFDCLTLRVLDTETKKWLFVKVWDPTIKDEWEKLNGDPTPSAVMILFGSKRRDIIHIDGTIFLFNSSQYLLMVDANTLRWNAQTLNFPIGQQIVYLGHSENKNQIYLRIGAGYEYFVLYKEGENLTWTRLHEDWFPKGVIDNGCNALIGDSLFFICWQLDWKQPLTIYKLDYHSHTWNSVDATGPSFKVRYLRPHIVSRFGNKLYIEMTEPFPSIEYADEFDEPLTRQLVDPTKQQSVIPFYVLDTGMLQPPSLIDCCIYAIGSKPKKYEKASMLSDDLLQRLIIEWRRLGKFNLGTLSLLTRSNLLSLCIPGTYGMDDAWLVEIAKIRTLKELDVSFCRKLSWKGLKALTELENLERLVAKGTFSDEEITYFFKLCGDQLMPRLREIETGDEGKSRKRERLDSMVEESDGDSNDEENEKTEEKEKEQESKKKRKLEERKEGKDDK